MIDENLQLVEPAEDEAVEDNVKDTGVVDAVKVAETALLVAMMERIVTQEIQLRLKSTKPHRSIFPLRMKRIRVRMTHPSYRLLNLL